MRMNNANYPKYVKTIDGYIGVFQHLEYGLFPVYRFPGGARIADDYEIEHGTDDYEIIKGDHTYE